jgi:hypothetical protein
LLKYCRCSNRTLHCPWLKVFSFPDPEDNALEVNIDFMHSSIL